MAKLICIIGKSGSGKDTLFKNIIDDNRFMVTPIIPYTTRPKRKGEIDGIDYHFVSFDELQQAELNNEIIEKRTYHTDKGDWYYYTKSFDFRFNDELAIIITTPAALKELSRKFGENNIIIIYLDADDITRIDRTLQREKKEKIPNYQEICRRYLADEHDFASFANNELKLYKSCYKIDSNKSISDCMNQFENIYKLIIGQKKTSKTIVLKSISSCESDFYTLCSEYIAGSKTEYADFKLLFEVKKESLC
jgi:guanylate kinase